MAEWLQILLSAFPGIVGAITTILLIKVNIKFKNAETRDKEADTKTKEVASKNKQCEEWKQLYQEAQRRVDDAENECKALLKRNADLRDEISTYKFKAEQLAWFRCTINNCPNRRPPHVYDKDGNELEAQR